MINEYQLPKEFTQRWVTALRSGKYKQGTEVLVNSNGVYCCLGVAGKLCNIPDDKMYLNGDFEDLIEEDSDALEFMQGIPLQLIDGPIVRKLITLNDFELLTFPQIADWLEANVEFVEEVPNA